MIFILIGIGFLYCAYLAYKHIPNKLAAVVVSGIIGIIGLVFIL